MYIEQDTLEMFQKFVEWHAEQVKNLEVFVSHPKANINLGSMEIAGDSDLRAGFTAGIQVALLYLGELPITITREEPEEDEG